jgi:hypothetical protein
MLEVHGVLLGEVEAFFSGRSGFNGGSGPL